MKKVKNSEEPEELKAPAFKPVVDLEAPAFSEKKIEFKKEELTPKTKTIPIKLVLVDCIRMALKRGFKKKEIEKTLKEKYSEEDIENAFQFYKKAREKWQSFDF